MLNWEKHGIDIGKVRNGMTFCPKCHHTRKPKNRTKMELSVDITSGLFNCHNDGCGFRGKAIDTEMVKEKKEYIAPPPRLQAVGDKMVKWFESRGISNNTLLRLGVTESKEWMPQTSTERNCICFNYFQDEKLVNIKFRDGSKNFKLVKDAKLVFYNLDQLKGESECVICEGEIDCLSFHESGVYNTVSVPNGASKGNQKLEYLDNCIDYFDDKTKIVIATDGDSAGLALRDELARRLGKERCWLVRYPDGCKDANEVLLKYGKEGVKEFLESAYQFPIEGIEKVGDIDDEIMEIYEHGYPSGEAIGFKELDTCISYRTGDFTIVTGTPNAGKSTWLNNVLVRLANRKDWRIAMFTPEKQPNALLSSELIEIFTGKAMHPYDSRYKLGLDELKISKKFLDEYFWFMKIDEIDVTIEGILEKAKELVVRYGVKALVIDPWNYVEHKIPAGKSETQYISEELTKIKRFKDRYGVHVFLVAHPVKIRKDKEGKFEIPSLYDISGSANFFNKCDNGVVLYRNFATGATDIHVQKIRWSFIGKLGTVEFKYDGLTKRFAEVEEHFSSEISAYKNREQDVLEKVEEEDELPPPF